jgi:hypothetical protein
MTSKAFGLAQLGNAYADGALSNRNKIINGAMTIDQRNAGAAVTPTSNAQYVLDRWMPALSVASKYSVQRTAASAPIGFSHATLITSLSAYSPLAADFLYYAHKIEGHNVADLNWGTANAAKITVSFWVRSSLTGVFSVRLVNSGFDRSYVTTYTINSADTWEKKTITVSGDTSGTWDTTNGSGIELSFDLGSGSNWTTSSANSWQAASNIKLTGSVSLVGTNGATWYVTGVQLEAGDTATPFEHRSYGQELALCQRYFEKSYNTDVVPGTATFTGVFTNGGVTNLAAANYATRASTAYKVTKRATPTVTTFDTAGNSGKCNYPDSTTNQPYTVIHNGFSTFSAETSTLSNGTDTRCYWHFTSSAEL